MQAWCSGSVDGRRGDVNSASRNELVGCGRRHVNGHLTDTSTQIRVAMTANDKLNLTVLLQYRLEPLVPIDTSHIDQLDPRRHGRVMQGDQHGFAGQG